MTIEREARPIARVALWVGAIGLFVLAVAVVTRGIVGTLTNDLTAPGGAFWDFRDAGYFPVRAVLDSVVPYNVVEYFASYPVAQEFPLLPPTYILIHFPFILLSLPAASTAMFAVNLVAIVALSAWSVSLARYRVTPVAVLVVSGLMILSNGGRNVLNTGQITLLFVAGIYLALTARRDSLGSVGVFASLVKPAMGGPVVILLLAAGRVRRALIGAGAAFVMSFVLMLPMVGWAGGLADLIDILMDNLSYSASSPWISLETTTARIDVTATIAMLVDVVPSRGTEIAIGFAVIGAAGYALNSRRTTVWTGTRADAAIVLICLATLIGLYHSFYDLVILLLPILVVSRRDFAGGAIPDRLRLALLASLLFAAFNPFRFGPVVDVFSDSQRMIQVLSPGLTGTALVVALVLAMIVVMRLPRQVSGHAVREEFGQPRMTGASYDDGK
jgi:hypothetical protein